MQLLANKKQEWACGACHIIEWVAFAKHAAEEKAWESIRVRNMKYFFKVFSGRLSKMVTAIFFTEQSILEHPPFNLNDIL